MAMIKCRYCGADISDQAPFCPRCGTILKYKCTECGSVIDAGSGYCTVCGAPVGSRPADNGSAVYGAPGYEKAPENVAAQPVTGCGAQELTAEPYAEEPMKDTAAEEAAGEPVKKTKSRAGLWIALIIAAALAGVFFLLKPYLFKGRTADNTGPVSISAQYSGSTVKDTVLSSDNPGITVTAAYADGRTETVSGWTIDEPKTLAPEESATVIITYNDLKCELTVKCTSVLNADFAQYKVTDLTDFTSATYNTCKNTDVNTDKSGTLTARWTIAYDQMSDFDEATKCFYVPDAVVPKLLNQHTGAFEDEPGYEWRGMGVEIAFDKSNFCVDWTFRDYYTSERIEVNGWEEHSGIAAKFSVNYNGEIYDDCKLYYCCMSDGPDFQMYSFVKVPKGYDGIVLCYVNGKTHYTGPVNGTSHVDPDLPLDERLGDDPIIIRFR